MDFENQLTEMITRANGVFENISWGTMRGAVFTFGTMTDDHVANSRHYHKHMAEVAAVAPELRISVNDCKLNQWLMEQIIARRKSADNWSVDEQDFRMAGINA